MVQYIKSKIYVWHKWLGLLTLLPVVLWCLSGVMHPFMSHWFKPRIAKEFLQPRLIQRKHLQISLLDALKKNDIESFKHVRIVHFDNVTYYQIKQTTDELAYINTQTGDTLPNGDVRYAEWLTRYFLQDSVSKIVAISPQTTFEQSYKYVNRLLPVWKVSLARADAMDVYVETASSRLGTFNTKTRKAFLWIFDTFHNWSFIDNIANNTVRISLIILILSIIIVSSLSGILIYGFWWRQFRKEPNPTTKFARLRKYHRQIGIAIAFVSLAFAASGAYHATRKLEPNVLPQMMIQPVLSTAILADSAAQNLDSLPIQWHKLHNIRIVQMQDSFYYQCFYLKTDSSAAETAYINIHTGEFLTEGDARYAKSLATQFATKLGRTDIADAAPKAMRVLTAFESREYDFIFKRLPVMQLAFDTDDKSTLYIETATSRLAAHITQAARIEGYTFAVFHKFLLLDWAGKNVRDGVMVLAALGILVVSLMGVALLFRK